MEDIIVTDSIGESPQSKRGQCSHVGRWWIVCVATLPKAVGVAIVKRSLLVCFDPSEAVVPLQRTDCRYSTMYCPWMNYREISSLPAFHGRRESAKLLAESCRRSATLESIHKGQVSGLNQGQIVSGVRLSW
eukprot:scaffold6903_cov119-Skeletonema_marinoi.AAC.2